MVLAVAVILFQMQALRPKADATVAPRQELVRYAENIPAPGLFGAFAPIVPPSGTPSAPFAEDGQFLSLPDDDGTNTAAAASGQTPRGREVRRPEAAIHGHRAIE